MFTLHHGFWMYVFSRSHRETWKFVLGSMLPDYVYGIFFIILLINGLVDFKELLSVNPLKMMALLPLYPWVVKVDLIGHSLVVWAFFMILSLMPHLRTMQAFTIGWGSHILVDGLTHAAHANFYLYPLSMAQVHSPVSYWDVRYFADEFRIVNGTLMGITIIYLISRTIYQWWKKKKKH
jgi:hypothetical protein